MDRRGLKQRIFSRLFQNPQWLDLRPLSVRLDADVALVHFYAVWVVDSEGEATQMQQKRFEVYRKIKGKYHFLGGAVTPVP